MPIQEIVLINGPPRSGKDTLGQLLWDAAFYEPLKFAEPLRQAVPAIFMIDEAVWLDLLTNHKGEPSPLLEGMTPREAMIWVSEEVCKPKFGDDYFGRVMARRIDHDGYERVCITDSGFTGEAEVLRSAFGTDKLKLIRLRRQGTSYDGDSRDRVELPGVPTLDLSNDQEPHEMRDFALSWLDSLARAA